MRASVPEAKRWARRFRGLLWGTYPWRPRYARQSAKAQPTRSLWVPEGSLAGVCWCHEMALELVCGADFCCNRHCKTSPVVLEGFGGQVWPKIGRKPTQQIPARQCARSKAMGETGQKHAVGHLPSTSETCAAERQGPVHEVLIFLCLRNRS